MNTKSLRQHRIEKGWTQTELARRSGLNNYQISQYEREKSMPSGLALQKLAAALGVDANDIMLEPLDRAA